MKYVSWFAGVGGFDLAFNRAGHECVGACEIEPHARRVYEKNLGRPAFFPEDITKVKAEDIPDADIWVGGFPCQDLSVAGKRAGIHAGRSGLVFDLIRLATVKRPRMILLENVPGLLSGRTGEDDDGDGDSGNPAGEIRPAEEGVDESAGGSASWFGALLGALVDAGYGSIAWRCLDARFFRVAQRRRRVFIECHLGEDADTFALFLEPQGGGGNPETGGEAREGPAAAARIGAAESGGGDASDIAGTLGGGSGKRGWCDDLDRAGAFPIEEASYFEPRVARNGRGAPDAVAAPLKARSGEDGRGDSAPHVFSPGDYGGYREGAGTLRARDAKMKGDHMVVDSGDVAATLRESDGHHGRSSPRGDGQDNLVAYQGHGSNIGPMGTLRAGNGNETGGVPFVAEPAYCIEDPGRKMSGGPEVGLGVQEEVAYTLQAGARHAVAQAPVSPPVMGVFERTGGTETEPDRLVVECVPQDDAPPCKEGGADDPVAGEPKDIIAFDWKTGGNKEYQPSVVRKGDYAGSVQAVKQDAVAYNVHSAESCAKEHHAYRTEHARCLDSNGGFAASQGGTIVGVPPQEPMAVGENVRNELRLMPHTTALAGGGGKPGQGYQAVLLPPEPAAPDPLHGGAVAFEPRYYTRDNKTGGAPSDTAGITNAHKAGDSAPHILVDGEPPTEEPIVVGGDSAASTPDLPNLRAGCGRGGEMAVLMEGEVAPALRTNPYNNSDPGMEARMLVQQEPMAFSSKDNGRDATVGLSPTLRSGVHKNSHPNAGVPPAIASSNGGGAQRAGLVRRLTPTECERLQGFPDSWTCTCGVQPYSTAACKCSDGPRYRSLGNAVCVPVVFWIARRLALIPVVGVPA